MNLKIRSEDQFEHGREMNTNTIKKTSWAIIIFYLLIALEFFYMASPFAIYFYSVYGPGLNFLNSNPAIWWLSSMFLPHIVVETSSFLLNMHNIIGMALAVTGFLAFCIGAGQVYYYKITRKGAVTGGVYNLVRHPQYISLTICSFGVLLLWPRYIVLLSFITMLFAYYFLAKIEEDQCEEKFGEAYQKYKKRTGMFLPFNIPFLQKKTIIPKRGMKRYLVIIIVFLVISLIAIGMANGLRNVTLNSLYALYSEDAVYISLVKVERNSLERIVKTALANPNVKSRLKSGSDNVHEKYINYILPIKMYVSEIPMNFDEGLRHEHFLLQDYDKNQYKVIFTRAILSNTREDAEGKNILLNTVKRLPIIEVHIDLSQGQVTNVQNPPKKVPYQDIPVPLY